MLNFKKIVLAIAVVSSLAACSRVEPNEAGVLMENYGKAGKSDFSIVSGRVNTMWFGTELFTVPLFEQRQSYEKGIILKAADNTEFTASPMYSYQVIRERAVDVVFDNKQINSTGTDFLNSLSDNILEPRIIDIMRETSRKYRTDDLMKDSGSLEYEKAVQDQVAKEFKNRGLLLKSFSAQLEFSKKVTEKIDKRNEVNTNLSVLDQEINQQKKRNELAELKAQEQIILSKGLTPEILKQQQIEKWDGKLPMYGGNSDLQFLVGTK